MLEHRERSLPVYFLLDEFRQLKKMTEITTKLPYVAGYNIKMAFVIQDLKRRKLEVKDALFLADCGLVPATAGLRRG